MNKRNFLKTLSSAALGTLMVGNFSNVRMMEATDEEYNKISKQKNENFLKKRAVMMNNEKAYGKAMEKESLKKINAEFQDTRARVLLECRIKDLQERYKNNPAAVNEVSKKLNELLGKQFNEENDPSAIQDISVLLAEHIVYYSRINNVNVKDTDLIDCVMINICGEFSFGFRNIIITDIIKKLENIAKNVTENINKGV